MSSVATPQQITGPPPYAIGSPIGTTTVAEPEGVKLGDIVRILKQRKLTIIITTIVLYLLVCFATAVIWKFAPAYTSEAFFELDPPKTGDPFTPQREEVNTQYMEQLLQTEAAKLKSLPLMLDVVSLPEIKATAYYRWYESNVMEAAVGLAEKDLHSAPVRNTRLIRIALSCRDKTEARTIVQKIVERYRQKFIDEVEDAMRVQSEGLKNTLANLENELDEKRNELKIFRARANVPAMETRRFEAREYVVFLKTELSQMGAAVASLQSQLDSLAGIDPSRLPLTAEQQLIIDSDPILRYWRSQVENLDVELEAVKTQYGPNHRNVVVLRQRRAGYREKEVGKREELMDQVRARQIETLRQQLAQTRNVQARMQEQLEEVEAEERDLDRNIQAFRQMEEDAQRLAERISQVELKLTEAEHAKGDRSRIRLRLRQGPEEAVEPSRPRPIPYLGGGFLLAIAGGVGLAFLRELTDQAVRTPVDVVRFGHLSVLGCIPLLHDEEADVDDIEDAVRLAPHSLVAEAFRRTRANLQFSGPAESQRSLLITSPSPGDGKTAVAINLATTLAHSNLRVLLIDCNFRRPAIRGAFPGTRPEGLSNLLIGQGGLEELTTKTDLPNLDVLSSGPLPPTPAELLGSAQMHELMEQAVKQYDRVILDGPPTLLVTDATVMAMQVDGVILVARADENTRGTLKRAREQLENTNARVVGAILNGVKARAGGYFKQQYREFYDYTSEEVIPAELPGPAPASEADAKDDAQPQT